MMTHSGKLGRLYTSFILIVTVLCSVPFALADETKAEQQLNDAVKSFEAILQKAADKGLLERKGSETEKAPIEGGHAFVYDVFSSWAWRRGHLSQ